MSSISDNDSLIDNWDLGLYMLVCIQRDAKAELDSGFLAIWEGNPEPREWAKSGQSPVLHFTKRDEPS